MSRENPKIGVIGTGPIGLGTAALLSTHGLETQIWSPSGNFTSEIGSCAEVIVRGAVEKKFKASLALSASSLVQNCDVIVIAVPANGHKDIIDQIAGHLREEQSVIISSHTPFGSQYLKTLLAARKIEPLIVAWSTTIVSGRKTDANQVHTNTVRDRVDIATLPENRENEGLELCQRLFGNRFVLRGGLLAITLSNLNPQNHLGIALCNFTRIEKGEVWQQAANVTNSVGKLLEKLDDERLAIASAFNLKVRDIHEHFSQSFHVPVGSVADMSAAMVANGHTGCGPTNVETRYVLEDVPYGLVPVAWLGRQVGCTAVLHEAGIAIFNALYGRDFYSENTLMTALSLDEMSLTELQEFLGSGASKSGTENTGNASKARHYGKHTNEAKQKGEDNV